MNVLGIETSCDETAAAVVKDGRVILSNVVVSSLKEHAAYGGIIPEIASRRQMECLAAVVAQALEQAGISLDAVEAVAVTRSPGLIGSLLVGLSFARALGYQRQKPVVEVDHVKAHICANFLRRPDAEGWTAPRLPAIGLVVSGGHTQLYLFKNFQEIKLLGQTRDDAAGEAFDKVARILGLGYPGGPVIDQLAAAGKNTDLVFKAGALPGSLDFSFSGIKTSVLYHQRKHAVLNRQDKARIAFSFQEGVIASLVEKSRLACKRNKISTLLVGGGVAANSELRRQLGGLAQTEGWDVRYPPMDLCVDNAAMIAGLGYHQLRIPVSQTQAGLKSFAGHRPPIVRQPRD
jgi:N6-L-threonylcarbamoyladenine synthase